MNPFINNSENILLRDGDYEGRRVAYAQLKFQMYLFLVDEIEKLRRNDPGLDGIDSMQIQVRNHVVDETKDIIRHFFNQAGK